MCFLKRLFLRISISLLILPICFGVLSTFTVKGLNVLITAVLSSWSNSSNISAESECDSDACCRSLQAVMGVFLGVGELLLCLVIFC